MSDPLEAMQRAMGEAMVKRTDAEIMDIGREEKKDLITVSSEMVSGFSFHLDRDIRRQQLIAMFIVFLKGDQTIYTPLAWQLQRVEQGFASREDLSVTPLGEDFARTMCDELAKQGIRPDTWDERDIRIKELKERIRFLETVVIKNLGITKEDLRLIRED
jgi:hypothetical protein